MQKKRRPIITLWQEKDGRWWWREDQQRPREVTPEDIARHGWFEKYIKGGG